MDNTQIDEDLIPNLAYESCLEWVKDISKEDFEKIKSDKSLSFGQPQKQNSNQIGVYKVVDFLPIDYSLNPDNAPEKGYEWIADVYYSPDAPKEINAEVLNDHKNGYLFGEAASINTMDNGFIGEYRRIKKRQVFRPA